MVEGEMLISNKLSFKNILNLCLFFKSTLGQRNVGERLRLSMCLFDHIYVSMIHVNIRLCIMAN